MTREEVLAMEPGRELDTLVVEKVMGEDLKRCRRIGGCLKEITGNPLVSCVCDKAKFRAKPYSTDISAAWEVFERLIGQHSDATLTYPWCVVANFDTFDWCQWRIKAEGDTAPETICKAALLSLISEETP